MTKEQINDLQECALMAEIGEDKDCSSCSCNGCIAENQSNLTANEYQKAALRTANSENLEDLLLNGVLGLCGESGEVSDHIKKWKFQGHDLDKEKLLNELGDVCWYIAVLAKALETDLETVMNLNIKKLKNRYPNGFESERSINRED